jgi:hypothetical protein
MPSTNSTAPNAEQIAAIERFADLRGRLWKSALRHYWERGFPVWMGDDAALLQQLRNTCGPRWLIKYRRPK